MKLKVEIAQASDPGRDPNKQVNEDSCGYVESKFGHLAVLCDGMGGHHGGQEASRRAITTIFEYMDRADPTMATPAVALKSAVEEAARRVYELGGGPDNRTRPGSTVVAMLMHDHGVDVAHVGDSRAYVIRSGQIYPLTRDHSMVQGLIDSGQITEEQAIGHPDANKITRALGMRPEVDVELRPEPMELFVGDILLQSSDGLTDLALSKDILGATQQALNSGGIEHACKQLVQLANDRGGHDNITVQIARVLATAPSRTAAPSPTALPASETGAPTVPMGPAHLAAGRGPAGGAVPPTSPGQIQPTAPPGTPLPAQVTPALLGHGVAPTAVDGRFGANQVGPTVTELDAPPSSSPVWSSGMYAGPGGTPRPGFAAYVEGAAAALPLPPPAMTPGPPPAGFPPQPAPPQPTMADAHGAGAAYPAAYAAGYPGPDGMSLGLYGQRQSRGGIVFLITGISIVVAVLILILLWVLGFLN